LKKINKKNESDIIFDKFIFPICKKYEFLFKKNFGPKEEEKEDFILENYLNNNFEIILNKIDELLCSNSRKINEKEEIERINYDLLNNTFFNENDLYDLEDYYFDYLKKKNQIFHIEKNYKLKDKSINKIFEEEQNNKIYDPFQMEVETENDLKNIENKNLEENNSNYNLKTSDLSIADFHNKNIKNNNHLNDNFLYDSYSNFNKYSRDYFPKISFKNERFKNSDPFLKTFNPKFLKKENIDKKIFRKFRNYVKEKFQKESNNIIFSPELEFWKNFCCSNLLPPMKYKNYEFKSFNTKYFLWLFSQFGSINLFKEFIKEKGNLVIENFINEYNLENSTEINIIEKLREYLNKIPIIYSRNNQNNDIKYFRKENFNYNNLEDTYLGIKDFNDDPTINVFYTNFNFDLNEKNNLNLDNEKEDEYIQRLNSPALNLSFHYLK
jgi:hypothetical protein